MGCINRHYKTPCLQSLFFRAFFMFALGMLPCTHHAATLNDLLAAELQVSHPSQHHRSLLQSCTPSDSSSLLLPSNSDVISKELRQSSCSHNHIPCPRNAFMIFHSEFCAGEKISCSLICLLITVQHRTKSPCLLVGSNITIHLLSTHLISSFQVVNYVSQKLLCSNCCRLLGSRSAMYT